MNTSFWAPYISDGTIQAICWTLIHSLWIGMIIALITGVIISLTRKSAATLRYRLLCAALVLFVIAIGITYTIELQSNPGVSAAAGAAKFFITTTDAASNHQVAAVMPNQNIIDRARGFLNQNVSIIFLVWLLFFVLKSLKMISGLLYIQRIRHYKTHAVTEELKHKIEQLSSQMGIRRAVRLVQSELVKVPVAVGWLKPIILLPLGIAFQLTPEQLDGILWHELAHIHRRDYLVNILQGLVETVFFFNPGLLWLSSLIRTEREACCDDMVLSRMKRKANYLEALLSFGYGEFKQAGLAMSIGSGNQLRDRLKRMISQENKRLSVAEKSVLAIGLALLSAFTTISKNNPIIKHLTVKFTSKSGQVTNKTMAVSLYSLPKDQRLDDRKPQGREKHTIIVADTSIRFTSVLFKNSDADWANNDIDAKDDKGNVYHFIVVDGKIASMELNGVKVEESKLPDYEYTLQLIISELMEKRRMRETDAVRFKAMEPQARLQAIKMQLMEDSLKAAEPKLKSMKAMKMQKRMHDDSIGYAAELKKMMNIITELVKDKVVPDAASVKWFGLSNTEFIVNGQRQPNEMQQRYKAKYGVHLDYGLYYGPVKMYGKGVFIDFSNHPPPPPPPPGPARPARPARPGAKYMGAATPNSPDGAAWKLQQLIRQRQLFAAEQNDKYQQLIKQQHLLEAKQYLQVQQEWLKQQRTKFNIEVQPAINGVIADLVSANVIGDKSDLIKFNLTNSALMVNGKKQPDELHERLKAKYLEQQKLKFGIADDPNFGLHYDINGNMGIGITMGPDSP